MRDTTQLDAIVLKAACAAGMSLYEFVATKRHNAVNKVIRHDAIAEATRLGFRRGEIAAAFGINPRLVSDVLRARRNGPYERASRDITGQKFGRLTVVDGRMRDCQCECECGNSAVVGRHALVAGNRKSCGCLQSKYGGGVKPEKPRGMTKEQVAWARGVFRDGPDSDRSEAGLILLFYHERRLEREAAAERDRASELLYHREYHAGYRLSLAARRA